MKPLIKVRDTAGSWRVEAIGPGEKLCLSAPTRLPGRSGLQLAGGAYWYCVFPLHDFVSVEMLRVIAARAEAEN